MSSQFKASVLKLSVISSPKSIVSNGLSNTLMTFIPYFFLNLFTLKIQKHGGQEQNP